MFSFRITILNACDDIGWEMQLDPLKTVRAVGTRDPCVTENGLMDSIKEKISDSRKL